MSNELKLNIADITFLFIAHKRASALRSSFPYRLFLTGGKPEVVLRLYYGSDFRRNSSCPGRVLFDTEVNWKLYYSNRKHVLEMRDRSAVFAPDFTSGEIYITKNRDNSPFSYPLDEVLMINLLGRNRGILMHACGLKDEDGNAILFAGNSGAGKSTMANLWKGQKRVAILSDDRVIVRKNRGSFWAYGTPWHGDVKLCSPEKAPLKRIFFLKHAAKNSARELEPLDAASRLIVCSFPTFWNKRGMEFTLGFCNELSRQVPCYELGFIPDESVLDIARR